MALNNVPLSGQTLDQTRQQINDNFNNISDQFAVDHQAFNTTGQGKHKGIHVIDGVPSPSTASNEIGIYNTVTTGVPALFIQKGTATAIDITTLSGNATQGSVKLPSGLIYKWGRSTTNGSGLETVNFTVAFSTVFQVSASISVVGGSANPNSNDRIIQVYNYTNSLFSVVSYLPDTARTRTSASYVWHAIGI